MRLIHGLRLAIVLAVAMLDHGEVFAEAPAFPSRPITIVVPYAAGGVGDAVSRIVGEKVGALLGQPVIVDPKPGANSNLGTMYVARAAADGYTWVLAAPALTVNPSLYKEGVWSVKDFTAVGMAVTAPAVLVVPSELPAKSLDQFVKMVRASPGKYNYGNPGIGSSLHMNSEMFKLAAGIDLQSVVYKGQPPALLGLLRNDVSMMVPSVGLVIENIKAGKLRALAVISDKRVAALPDVPTLAEAGYPQANIVPWYGFAVPSSTPEAIKRRINGAINTALASPDVQEKLRNLQMEPERPRSLEELAAVMRSDSHQYATTVLKGNLKPE